MLTVLIYSIARRKFLLPKRENLKEIATVSCFQTIIQYLFFYIGLSLTTGVKGTVISGSNCFFSILCATLIFRQEKLTLKKVIADGGAAIIMSHMGKPKGKVNPKLSLGQIRAAVEAALYAMWKKCPKQIRKKKSLVFVIGWDAWDAYDQYISDKQVKYSENTEVNRYRFKGKKIVPIVGIPDHTIVLGEFSTGMESNLWMGVDYANDTEVLKVDRLQANSELFFFQMRMKMDVNIVRPAEIVVHTAYTKTA